MAPELYPEGMYDCATARLECSVAQAGFGSGFCGPNRCAGTDMALQERNYWLTTTEFPTTDPSSPLPDVIDVAVMGAGFTGLSAARTLARRGARVAVLESETIGWGASS